MHNDQVITVANVTLIIATIAALSVGQVLFKMASESINFAQPSTLLSIPLMAALFVYGLATIAWLAILSRVPLSVAFPFYGLGFFFVPILSAIFLGERLKMTTLAGAAIIALGIFVCTRD